MKKLILLFILLAAFEAVKAQDANPEQATDTVQNISLWTLYPGYIVTNENDTTRGYIMLGNLIYNQSKALYFKNETDTKYSAKYKAKKIKSYKVGPRSYDSFKYRPNMSEANGYHFFMKIIDGPITEYRWYYEPEERTRQRVEINEDNILLSKIDLSFNENDLQYSKIGRKLNGKPFSFNMVLNFKNAMSKLVSDYPELAKKIKSKQEGYRVADQEKIIKEYNAWYLKTHPDWKKQ